MSDLVWMSTYQFGAVYTDCDDDEASCLIIVNAPVSTMVNLLSRHEEHVDIIEYNISIVA